MGTLERKEREKELKKNAMLSAAEALILEKGLDHLNMDEVADRAEVSKGSLYMYFGNKTDLILGICEKASNLLSAKINKVLLEEKTGLELVYSIGATFIKFATEHPEFFKAMRFHDDLRDFETINESDYSSHCQENMKSSFTAMVRAIQIGIQDGSIRTDYEPKELALLLWGTSHGIVNMVYFHQNKKHFNLIDETGLDVKSIFKNYMKMIGCGIASDETLINYDDESFFETDSE